MEIKEFLHPARASHVIIPRDLPMFVKTREKSLWVAEEKLDGARYLLYMGETESQLRSRNWSVDGSGPVDKSSNCPHLAKGYGPHSGTVLDGEIKLPGCLGETISIMGAGPEKAIARQNEMGYVQYHVFDILSFKGTDTRSMPWTERNKLLLHVLSEISNPHMVYVSHYSLSDSVSAYNTIVGSGGEGLVLKQTNGVYGEGWTKVKKLITLDVVVTGFTEGNGKYRGQVGAVKFGLFKDGGLVEVGQCSGMDDDLRLEISRSKEKFEGKVIEVSGQEFTKDMRLRHPRFERPRPDKNPSDCVWSEQISQLGALIGV